MLYLVAFALLLFLACRKAYPGVARLHQIARGVGSKRSRTGQIPSLGDATSDQLISGLNQKVFTSVDLVNVGRLHAVLEGENVIHLTTELEIGLYC